MIKNRKSKNFAEIKRGGEAYIFFGKQKILIAGTKNFILISLDFKAVTKTFFSSSPQTKQIGEQDITSKRNAAVVTGSP